MKNLIKHYIQKIIHYLHFELLRGFFIISAAWLIQSVIIRRESENLLILFVVFILRTLIENLRTKKFIELSLKFQQELRNHLHRIIFLNTANSGELLTLIFDTVESFDDLFVHVLPNILTILVLIPMILITTAIMDPLTALIFLLTLPIAPFLLYLIGQAVSEKNQQAWSALSKLNGDFKELLSAITTLKIFRRIEPAVAKLQTTSEQSAQATLNVLKLAFVSAFVLELITTLSIALIAVTVGLRLVDDKISFDIALFLLLLAPEFFAPIRSIGVTFHSAVKAKDSSKLLEKYFNAPSISHFILPNSLFTKKITVITGESGSGKTTFLKNLIKHLDVKNIAYVPQQPHLFKSSVRENLTLFKPLDDIQAKKILNVVDLNLNLNDEIKALSRGQLQRLGLARALLKNAQILILDEPTAGLDVDTEQKILQLLNHYRQHCTMIIATHRPAVIDFADEVISLDD